MILILLFEEFSFSFNSFLVAIICLAITLAKLKPWLTLVFAWILLFIEELLEALLILFAVFVICNIWVLYSPDCVGIWVSLLILFCLIIKLLLIFFPLLLEALLVVFIIVLLIFKKGLGSFTFEVIRLVWICIWFPLLLLLLLSFICLFLEELPFFLSKLKGLDISGFSSLLLKVAVLKLLIIELFDWLELI